MTEDILVRLTDKNDQYAYALTEKMVKESMETDAWFGCFEAFASLLNHPKSYVRNRAVHLIAANVQWDDDNTFESILPAFLNHVTDEKPITARQCIQALSSIGLARPAYIPRIIDRLQRADLSRYKASMRPLIEKDIRNTLLVFQSITEDR